MKNLLFSIAALAIFATPAFAGNIVNVAGASGIALNGYDPVAFFTEGKPTHGDASITATHNGASYMFASKRNRAMFEKDPEKYAPQYGGFCAYGVSVGALFPVDISTWQIVDGKLYLNLNPMIQTLFNQDVEGHLAKADKKWPALVQKHSM